VKVWMCLRPITSSPSIMEPERDILFPAENHNDNIAENIEYSKV
jgi:hypothetical protein